jgi:hypothetical protein
MAQQQRGQWRSLASAPLADGKLGVHSPRSSDPQMSEMVPPASVKGAEPKKPQRNREASRQPMLGARAQGILKMM